MKNALTRLGTLAVLTAGFLTAHLASANTALWIGNPGVTATTNWSDNANWNNVGGGGAGPLQNDVKFGGTGAAGAAGTITSVADVNQHPFSVAYTNGPGQFHTTFIPAGIGLTNDNGLTVGGLTADAYTTVVYLTGGGILVQNGTPVTIQNYGNTVSTALATLDLSGLANFVYTNSGGTINVGSTGGNRSAGSLSLAGGSNYITVGTLNLGTGSGANAATSSLKLGAGTNIINVGTFNIVNNKNSATLSFQAGTGGLRLRGVGGTDADRANFTVANRNQTGTGTATGTLSLNGYPVDIKAGTMIVGQNSAGSSTDTGTGILQFDTGTVDVTTLNLAVCSNPSASGVANGTVTVGSAGTLIIGSGGLSLANRTGATAVTATGTLNISGGSVITTNSILKTTIIGTGNITMTGGALTVAAGKTVGTPAIPIDNFTLGSATLNLAVLNNLTNIVVTTLNLVDDANTVNVSALPSIGGFPTQFPLLSYASSIGAGSLALGTLPSTFKGYVSNDTVNTLWLVITNGPFIAKSDLWAGAANYNWDTTSLNWTNAGVAVAYNEGDFVTFNDSARTNNVNLTGARLPASLTISNSVLNYSFSGPGSIGGGITLVKDGSASLRLAETGGDNFNGGILVTNGTLTLDNPNSAISGGLTVNNGAIAQIGNGDATGTLPSGAVDVEGTLVFDRTDNVTVATAISGNGSLTQTGSGKVTLTGANNYVGATIIANGTLALSGAGSVSSSALVVVSNATFDVSAASPQTALTTLNLTNSTLDVVLTNLSAPITVSSLNVDGVISAQNTINVLALPPVASYPATLTIITSTSPINLVGGVFNFVVGALPAATPAYVASVTESADQTAVLLTLTAGPVGVRPAVYWTGSDVPNLNTNWSDRVNWQLPGAPGAADNVIFNNTAAQTASALSIPGGGSSALIPENFNNIVDANFTVASLTYTNLGGTYHNTDIASGRALNITNFLTVGALDSGSTAQQEFVTVSGTNATLSLSNTNASLQVWVGSGSVGGSQATLDLSALDNFNATISRLTVGASAINNAVNRPSGILYLAKTNTIRAGFQTTTSEAGTTTGNSGIVVADCNQNAGSASYLYLGQVNTISADTIGIGRQKAPGHLLFNPIYANVAPYPSLTLQGFSSGQVSIFDISDGAGNTGTTTMTADVNLSGGRVTATVDTMNIGRASSGGTSGTATGSLEFDAGTITVNNANVGLQPTNNTKVGVGTLGVNSNAVIGVGATLVVRGSLNLGAAPAGGASAATSGTLGITNGTVLANAIAPGTGSVSTITLAGGQLTVTNVLGNSTAPLGTLNLTPLDTPDDTANVLSLPVRTNSAGITVTTLNLDGLDTTTNIINVESVGPVGATPVELPLIQYGTMNFVSGSTFNVGLGTLPSGYAGSLVNDTANNVIALMLTSAIHPQPRITAISVQSGTNVVLSGVNGFANVTYSVVSSTNVTLPLASWTSVGTGIFGQDGSFSFAATVSATQQQFFSVRAP
jgi:autotransporter-associated beta strand protein